MTPEYRIWLGIKMRCHNHRKDCFADYGGRGIVVVDEWRTSFQQFIADIGPRPSPMHSIERKDNNGPYSAENCYWATKREQTRNTRKNHWLQFNGESVTLTDLAARHNIRPSTLFHRLTKLGLPIEMALTGKPNRDRRFDGQAPRVRKPHKLTTEAARAIKRRFESGATKTDIAKEFGVARSLVFAIATGKIWRNV